MDLRQLKYFACLYEVGSMTAAARRLNIVQPALSMQIRRLEGEFGTPLFERVARGVAPTAAGELCYRLSRPILEGVDQLRRTMTGRGEEAGRQIRFAVFHLVPGSVLSEALASAVEGFADETPELPVRYYETYGETLHQLLRGGDVDFIIANNAAAGPSTMVRLIASDRLAVISSARLRLLPKGTVRLRDLPRIKLALPSFHGSLHRSLDRHLRRAKVQIEQNLELFSVRATLELVKATDWVSILPDSSVRGPAQDDLQINPIVDPAIVRDIHVVHRSDRPLSGAVLRFIEILAEHATAAFAEWREPAPRRRKHPSRQRSVA